MPPRSSRSKGRSSANSELLVEIPPLVLDLPPDAQDEAAEERKDEAESGFTEWFKKQLTTHEMAPYSVELNVHSNTSN
jgi:hypothetical protein